MPKRQDLSGQKFNELTVLRYSHSHTQPGGQKRAIWWVQCSCGVEKQISTGTLKHSATVSCGHVGKNNRIIARKLPNNAAEKNYLYLSYKKRAEYTNRSFTLSKVEFLSLTEQNCFYCGTEPSNNRKSKSTTGITWKYNGLDRVDSNKGYELNNIVPCCWVCNRMKRDMKAQDFIIHAKKVAEYVEKRL
jgi:hypothetical protein